MNRQTNLILSAAVAAAFGATAMSAHAGVASALPAKIATVAISSNSQAIKGNQLSYSTQVPLSNATVYYVYVKLLTGTFSAIPNPAVVFSSPTGTMNAALTGSVGALSADSTFAVYTLASTTGAIPVNTLILFTPGAANATGEVDNLTSLLGGGNVNEQISIGSSSNTSSVLADIDSAAGGNIITFTAPQTYLALPSSASDGAWTAFGFGVDGPETVQINVSGSGATGVTLSVPVGPPPGTTFGGAPLTVDLGAFSVTDVAGVKDATQVNNWTIANEYPAGSLSATLTGNFAAESSIFVSSTANCGTPIVADAFTLNTAKTIATMSGGNTPASGVGVAICMTVNGTTVIPSTTPALSIALSTVVASLDQGAPEDFGPTNLYSLLPNGGTVVIRAYLPAATPFVDVVRIINNGQVSSAVSVARIDPTTGSIGAAGTLPGTLAAGAATNYTNTQIETALGGALLAGDRPRLLFTANTAIEGQNYIINPDGTVTTLHGIDAGSQP